MLVIESLDKKRNLIQITLDEIVSSLSNKSDYFLLDFLNICKNTFSTEHSGSGSSYVSNEATPTMQSKAIFIGNVRKPHMDIQIPQYIDFARQIQPKIITIAKNNGINILKNNHFCILLNSDSKHIEPITKDEYQYQLDWFKSAICNIETLSNLPYMFKPVDFGLRFEEILIDILDNKSTHIIQPNQFESKLSADNQLLEHEHCEHNSSFTDFPANNPANPLIRYFNQYFKSKKNSDCVNLSSQSKTDIFYKNKNGSLNEISIKTHKTSGKPTNLSTIRFNLSVSGFNLLDWKQHLDKDPIKTIKMFFNRQYNAMSHLKSPYASNKNDNVKFLLMYLYNVDNPNNHVSGNIHIINMKRMFIFLQYYVENNMVRCQYNPNSLDILVNNELAFRIRNESARKKCNTQIYFYLNFDNPNSLFSQLIDFNVPLHLDRQCWIQQ